MSIVLFSTPNNKNYQIHKPNFIVIVLPCNLYLIRLHYTGSSSELVYVNTFFQMDFF